VDPIDHAMAEAAGVLCGRTSTRDVVDATVVLVARRERAPIVTSDADDLARLDPSATLVRA
jgi:predicted nucleic acid-binding protein